MDISSWTRGKIPPGLTDHLTEETTNLIQWSGLFWQVDMYECYDMFMCRLYWWLLRGHLPWRDVWWRLWGDLSMPEWRDMPLCDWCMFLCRGIHGRIVSMPDLWSITGRFWSKFIPVLSDRCLLVSRLLLLSRHECTYCKVPYRRPYPIRSAPPFMWWKIIMITSSCDYYLPKFGETT